jgi:hypothetical protein
MRQRIPGRGNATAAAILAAGLFLAIGAAGCSRQPQTPRASVKACTQFGVAAIKHHVTVTSLPPACKGLTSAQVSFAVGSALHSAAIGARGKVQQRDRIGQASHFLAPMAAAAIATQGSKPEVRAPAAPRVSRTALGLVALASWLITVAVGLWMMTRWIVRSRTGRRPAGRLRRPPPLNFTHLGLAGLGLLAWIAYLVTGVAGLAWTACVLLALTTGLGMTLVFLPSRGRRAPVVTVGVHIVFASLTMLFTVLAAVGA